MITYTLSENCNSFTYVFKHSGKFTVSPCSLHIVGRLHVYPYMGRDARCRFDFQCIFSCYWAFTVHNFVKYGVRNADEGGELPLRYVASL